MRHVGAPIFVSRASTNSQITESANKSEISDPNKLTCVVKPNPAVSQIGGPVVTCAEFSDRMGSDGLSVVTHHQSSDPAKFFLGSTSRPHIVVILLAQGQRGTQIGSLLLRDHDIASDEGSAELVLVAHGCGVDACGSRAGWVDHGDQRGTPGAACPSICIHLLFVIIDLLLIQYL